MIQFGKIKKSYNGQVVLDVEDFSVEEGKIYVITGPNGSGKSTLAKILAGIMLDDSGKVKQPTINNKIISVGYAPQKPYIFDLNLEKNILVNGKDRKKCESLINKFEIEYLKGKNARKFSGGEQQKLALARFFMQDYDLAILDEPTAAMDKNSQTKAEKIIREYVKGKTLIMITHNIEQIKNIADVNIVMNNGKIV